jgi:hypothetical protein
MDESQEMDVYDLFGGSGFLELTLAMIERISF